MPSGTLGTRDRTTELRAWIWTWRTSGKWDIQAEELLSRFSTTEWTTIIRISIRITVLRIRGTFPATILTRTRAGHQMASTATELVAPVKSLPWLTTAFAESESRSIQKWVTLVWHWTYDRSCWSWIVKKDVTNNLFADCGGTHARSTLHDGCNWSEFDGL